MSTKKPYRLFSDGGTQFIAYQINDDPPVVEDLGRLHTNNESEYLAAIRVVTLALAQHPGSIELNSDSEVMVRQIQYRRDPAHAKAYQTREVRLYNLGTLLLSQLAQVPSEIKWVPREQNLAGVALEKYTRALAKARWKERQRVHKNSTT